MSSISHLKKQFTLAINIIDLLLIDNSVYKNGRMFFLEYH